MAYRYDILSPEQSLAFDSMTFPAYRRFLGGGCVAAGVWFKDQPAGLALCGQGNGRTTAELLSLYVAPFHRLGGVGTSLLGLAEAMLTAGGMDKMHTTWSETMAGSPAFRAVLAKREWRAPYKRLLTLYGDMKGDFGRRVRAKYPKYQSADCVPREYSLGSWADMTPAERAFILSKQGQPNWFAPRSNPFREERILVPDMSLVLRRKGEVAGWLTVHRTAPDTLRYTDVFIRADLKRAGAVAIAMVTHAFWLHIAEGTPKLTMGVERDNEPLIRMCESRMAMCSTLGWTWGAEKYLGV